MGNFPFKHVLASPLWKGTAVSVKLAGRDSTVIRKKTSASLSHARMVALVWTDIMATLVNANLDSEVKTIAIIVVIQYSILKL